MPLQGEVLAQTAIIAARSAPGEEGNRLFARMDRNALDFDH